MSNLRFRLQLIAFALMLGFVSASAQNIRYVKMASDGGNNANDGISWASPKADIQDAINDLVNNNLTGEVWVAEGTYYPTETTESSGSQYFKSFKIPAGITVRGGFLKTLEAVDDKQNTATTRPTVDSNIFGKATSSGNLDGEGTRGGVYSHKTVLSGAVTKKSISRVWNSKKEQFDFTFYGNSYHVVWFAMNGFDANGRANGLNKPAKLEGCVIEGGHAYSNDADKAHPHMAYGGGIYMVPNSFVYNCEVRNCDASRNGGGIYMDGGGIVRRTIVHHCQALGLGTEFGHGGGICEDGKGNSKTNPIVVAQSAVTNCVARIGGGMALLSNQTDKGKYAIVANSTLVNNNTASTEAGGVYTSQGGGLASMTIVNNKCNGSGIVQNGVTTGRAGGVYSRDEAYIGNTVIWGNECKTNNDVQYASSRTNSTSAEKTHFYYNAISKADNTDWSGATKMGVLSLDDKNSTEVADKGNNGYPLFENPTTKAGYLENYFTDGIATDFNWKVYSESALHHAGINTADLDYEGLTPAPQGTSYDMEFGVFNPRCTMGAFVSEMPSIAPNTTLKPDEAHFFVDPNYNFAQHHESEAKGMSWERPTRFLGNVLEYIIADRKKDVAEQTLKGLTIYVHVKEGVVDNTDSYKPGRVRTSSIEIPSNVTILGSYAISLSGTDLTKRNPVTTPTVISGKLFDDYKYNIAHLINIKDASNVTMDGFKLTLANANSTELTNENKNGAAITIINSNTDIKFKNIIVSNSLAESGAAVYADKATANFENCIFHNNTTAQINNSGVIYATNDSHLTFNHCDMLRNVGHASYLGSNGTTNVWQNSIFYGNMDRSMPDSNEDAGGGINYALAAFSGNTANASGDHCMFDSKSASFASKFGGGTAAEGGDTGNKWQYNLQYAFVDGTGQGYPRFVNPTKSVGYSETGDMTYYGRATSFEPHNNNPVVNKASYTDAHTTWGYDLVGTTRDFGGTPDIGAVENHKTEQYDEDGNTIENAYLTGQPAWGAIMYVRDYASNDALKNATLTTEQQTQYDGSSWDRAIIGNAMYAYEPGTIETSTAVNTYVKTTITSTGGTLKGYKVQIGGKYLKASGTSSVVLVDNENDASVWNVTNNTTTTTISSPIGTGTRYFWINDNGTKRYLILSGSNPNYTVSLNTATNNAGFTLANSGTGFTMSRRISTRTIYVRVVNGAFACSNSNSNDVATTTAINEGGTNKVTETFVDASGATAGSRVMTKVSNSRVSAFKELHVYNTLDELTRVIDAAGVSPIAYNIANLNYKSITVDDPDGDTGTVTVDDDPKYLTTTGSSLSMNTEKASSSKYALIKAGDAKLNDLVYIYDITNGKYVSSTFTLTELSVAEKWRIKQSAKSNRLNIIPSSVAEDASGVVVAEANAWNYNSSTSTLSLASRAENASQWVFENDLQYEVYNTNVTTPSGFVRINGLQYAVNMANKGLNLKPRQVTVTETYNKGDVTLVRTYQDLPEGTEDGQVWVAAGTYQNYSTYDADPAGYVSDAFGGENINKGYGYLMRNHVKVYGGFPKTGNPGMDERHPQLTDKVAMSAVNIAKHLDYRDYETILQTHATKGTKTNQGSVLAQPYECAVTEKYHSNRPRSRVVYEGAEWDGFTIRYGYRSGFSTTTDGGRRVGGPGVLVYENVVIRNCIIRDNLLSDKNQCRGGGVYCDGGILENCYVLDNKTNCSTSNFGGGIYMIQGTMFNSVIAGNQLVGAANPQGAGIFIESAKFYNNTIVNNTGGPAVGIYAASKASADLTVYNTIIIAGDNCGLLKRADATTPTEFVNCYLKSNKEDGTGVESILNGINSGTNYVIIKDNEAGPYSIPARKRSNMIYLPDAHTASGYTYGKITSLENYNPFVLSYADATSKYDFRIKQQTAGADGIDFNCVNAATEDIGNAELPDFDMDYTDRIQDCALDIGAYEYNGAYAIAPTAENNQAIFYVTPYGKGTSAGNDPENAACAQKLQKILDAAGRYKYVHPDYQVIVKVANDYTMANPTDGSEPAHFKYYATRTTDYTDQDVRVYSIEVPRGVELWGGYSDVPMTKDANGKVVKSSNETWSNTNNGFYSGTTDLRDITGNPTYFDSYYYNKDQKSAANTYHVITFTDRIYDPEGYAYMANEESKIKDQNAELSTYRELVSNDESQFAHMSKKAGADHVVGNVINIGTVGEPIYASNRAVIDGIFVTGGSANGSVASNSATLNINGFGGAAIVTDYAYVRNCILKNNKAINGGALALTDGAFVSGSLIINNEAENMGGGIYVFEEGAKLSNGTVINSKAKVGQPMDYRMAHVFTSTIAANNAEQGGGVWYTNDFEEDKYDKVNARFNSVAIWGNNAADQANVFGMVNPEQPTDDETNSDVFYPFSYSNIQNIRASGTNNASVQPLNKDGVRFVDTDHDVNTSNINLNTLVSANDKYGYYGLTNYSVLNSAGMPVDYYNQLKAAIAISDVDIMGKSYTADIQGTRKYVEAGARVLGKTLPTKQLMLRLFVANQNVDSELSYKFANLSGESNSAEEYYSQEGSSFAYPFSSLQDALDYIKLMRSKTKTGNGEETYISKYHANNLPFEILVGAGTYYPQESLTGSSNNVWAHTFAIPEGVSIMGGFNPQGGGTGSYYGRYYNANVSEAGSMTDGTDANNHFITANITPIPGGKPNDRGFTYGTENVNQNGINVTFQQWHIMDIGDRRAMDDNNHNGIIEPWEFKNQTIISGNAVNGETDGVYHILSACPDEDAVGILPNASIARAIPDHCDGYTDHEEGQQIRLNGLIVTGGNALTYLNTALDEYGSYNYYLGAGLNVDGNRYKDTYHNKSASLSFDNTHRAAYGVGYRDIPVSITNCQFRNNIAGYGGAITSNGSLTLFASSFEQNLAIGATEEGPFLDHEGNPIAGLNKIMYPGQGGAIHATHQLSAFNCLFANNEARLDEGETLTLAPVKHSSIRVPNPTIGTVRAAGGAIMMGSAGEHHIVNCDFVKNKANMYPAVFTMNPTYNQNATQVNTHYYSQIINTVAWQNEVNPDALKLAVGPDYAAFPFASKLMVNVGRKDRKNHSTGVVTPYVPAFTAAAAPVDQKALDGVAGNGKTAYENSVWQEAAWFCAYEDGVGFTPDNTNDLRALHYDPTLYSIEMIKSVNDNVYQNCNIQIVSDNGNLAGPNFGKPSVKAGYDGYMEGADWSPARVNRLTDNGNGFLKQSWESATPTFKKWGTAPTDRPYTTETATDYANDGAYPVTHYIVQFPEYKYYMSLGDEKYMETTSENQTETVTINGVSVTRQKNLPRISYDPTPGAELAYIDIGVYEYIKRPLKPAGNEVDILWVSTTEHPENGDADGSSWKQPTSDLQRAIETLLASRNGHKKEVRVMEGEYSPVTTHTENIGGVEKKIQAFVIDTKALNPAVVTPTTGETADHYAQSITIKGGYSADREYEYDPAEYETVIRQQDAGGSANTDYLIYIGDPTQRYAFNSYTESGNDFGAKLTEQSPVQTMPIQIDGVTLINDKAAANTKGSAIYYPDYTSDIKQPKAVNVGGTVTYYTDPKHYGEEEYKSPDNAPTDYPLLNNDGTNKENPAKIIITKTKVIGSGDPNATTDNGSAVYIGQYGGAAIIYNTVFGDNFGKPLEAYNTINVNNTFGQNGGQIVLKSLSYNATITGGTEAITPSMLHNTAMWMNNKGGAQFAMSDATISAGGEETLKNLVKVSTEAATLGDVSAENDANLDKIFTYNSFTGGNTNKTSDADLAGNKYNTGLIAENSNIISGPNFVDPNNADIYSRNYDIKPSLRLLNKGNGTRTVTKDGSGNITSEAYAGKYAELVINNKYDFSLETNTKVDVLNRTRIVSQDAAQRIDIGAYEYQGTLKDILYVDPNKSHSDIATGDNWDEALGYGDLQNAIDLVGLAYATKASESKTPSYVFVKGNSSTSKDKNMNETVILRDGVQVYGSILSSNTNWHLIKDEHGNQKYSSVKDYIRDIRLNREGVASTHANKTIVTGIKTSEFTSFDGNDSKSEKTPAIIDGFVVTDPNSPTAPVLDITNDSPDATIVVRNVIVADNDMSKADGDVNVAQISNGLIYEALFRDNQPKGNGAVLKVSNSPEGEYVNGTTTTRGFAVNVTVEGKTVGADFVSGEMYNYPIDGVRYQRDADGKIKTYESGQKLLTDEMPALVESKTQIYNSVTNSIDKKTVKDTNSTDKDSDDRTPGAYGTIVNKGISGYYYNIGRKPQEPTESTAADLNYQLSETSGYIDACSLDNPLTGVADNLAAFINYKTDRDILGNPRLLAGVTTGSKIDRGAFETWKVENDWHTGHDNSIAQQSGYTSTTAGTYEDDIKYTFYPHAGSAVYLMEGKYIVLDAPGAGYDETTSNPGFLLVKDGANLYTNGRHTTLSYVAVERNVPAEGAVVSVPYNMEYRANVMMNATATGDLVLKYDSPAEVRYYDGSKRSDWRHIFQKDYNANDPNNCWAVVGNGEVTAANNGVFYKPNETNGAGTYRFIAQGAVINDYIYEEYGPTKTVTLKKYDDAQSTNNGADFTDELDMGWNCIGIPYLVSEYKPYEKTSLSGENYSMNIPHTLWLYYDGKVDSEGNKVAPNGDAVNGDGGYYSVKAWKSEDADWHVAADTKKALWVGEGFFTQTATLSDTEDLTFYRPVAPALSAKSSAPRMNARYFYDANGIEDVDDDVNGNRRGESVIKFVRNGKVYIQKNGKTYTAAGQLVENADM